MTAPRDLNKEDKPSLLALSLPPSLADSLTHQHCAKDKASRQQANSAAVRAFCKKVLTQRMGGDTRPGRKGFRVELVRRTNRPTPPSPPAQHPYPSSPQPRHTCTRQHHTHNAARPSPPLYTSQEPFPMFSASVKLLCLKVWCCWLCPTHDSPLHKHLHVLT